MKLYTRQLNSLEELRKEKKRLKANIKDVSLMPAMGKDKDASVKDAPEAGIDGIFATVADLISSSPVQGIAGSLAMPLLSFLGKRIRKRAILKVVGEIGGGYAKWKAVELGYKAVRSYMKARKAKKTANKE